MILKTIYLVVFLGGLVLAVHSMLHGVERWKRKRSSKPSPVFNPPTVAALAIGFGACGYLLVARTGLGPLAALIISAMTGASAFSAMTVLMARWALRSSPDMSLHEEQEEKINGQVATVTLPIGRNEPGEITWFAWDRRHVIPARTADGSEVPAGTEVVIDVVEEGVARVELWSVVEQRL